MSKSSLHIRVATEKDTPQLLAIYAPYVEETAITFEYDVPSLEEFTERIQCIQTRYPYIVAEQKGEILGYAYASPFHERAAYDWAVETSIYVKPNQKRQGVGRALYQALEDILRAQNILNVNACIAYLDEPDPYLTQDSVRFHAHLGYQWVGQFRQCGYKFHRWYDMVWMEKHLGEHPVPPPKMRPFTQIRAQIEKQLKPR